jgi:Trk K+ transport system NAD-binding subunit
LVVINAVPGIGTIRGVADPMRRFRRIGGPRSAASVPPSSYVVCGDDPLAHRLVEELTKEHGYTVTVVLASRLRNHGPQIARLPGVRLVEAEQLSTETFIRAGLGTAAALALLRQDDVGNVDAALVAQELNPDLRLVIRMFNMSLGHHIRRLFRNCRVLSDSAIAAPAFVAEGLGEVAPSYIRLPGQTLYVARRADVSAGEVVCGLADTGAGTGSGEPDLLPPDERRCDLVLARANGGRATGPAQAAARQAAIGRSAGRVRLGLRLRQVSVATVRGILGLAVLVLLGILVASALALWLVDGRLGLGQAAYITLINAVGGANADLKMAGVEQVIQAVAALTGIAMVPVLTAAVVQALVNAREARASGVIQRPVAGHVVVLGLGNLGTRVVQQLRTLGVPVVAIDKSEGARGTSPARDLRIPVVIGDASRSSVLRRASIHTAQALLALSTDDSINLEAALQGRALKPDLRVVLRLFDGDFAGRVQTAFGITSSKSVSYLAAPAFGAAMLEQELIGTISVERRVLLVAEVRVEPGSALDGGTVGDAVAAGEARVIAISGTGGPYHHNWAPKAARELAAGDVLIVVATRTGLTAALTAAGPDGPRRAMSF